MCGIAGFYRRGGARSPETICQEMTARLTHRGPDQQKVWAEPETGIALGQARLAIIDLSETGAQPMTSSDGRWVITYNGEIYNHTELRAELEEHGRVFRGGSDTEVVLEAISEWGLQAALVKFIGMFALAIWDRSKRELHLARDHLGVKPLYWGQSNDFVLFASELKAFHAHPCWSGEVDPSSVASYLRYSYVPAPHTIYRDVWKLEPGQVITFATSGVVHAQAYWSLPDIKEAGALKTDSRTDDEAAARCEALLGDAVSRSMIADVPIGVLLSGGIDSTLVAALMQESSATPVRSFSIGFGDGDYDESVHAAAVARHIGTDHTELVIDPRDAMDCIPKMGSTFDEPFGDASQVPTYLIAQIAARHVRVVLSGDGGDEVFGGYNRYIYARRLQNILPDTLKPLVGKALSGISTGAWDRLSRLVPERQRPSQVGQKIHKTAQYLSETSPDRAYLRLVSQWQNPEEILTTSAEHTIKPFHSAFMNEDVVFRYRAQDMVTYLPDDILTKVDRATMAHSLESRVPLLDHRVVAFALRQPTDRLISANKGKLMLRRMLAKRVPDKIMNRPKRGFAVPLERWLVNELRDWSETLLSPDALARSGHLNPDPIRQLWADYKAGFTDSNHQYRLWNILMLQQWHEAWG